MRISVAAVIILCLVLLFFIGQASATVQVVASNTIRASNDTQYSTTTPLTWQEISRIPQSQLVNATGNINLNVSARTDANCGSGYDYIRVKKNDNIILSQQGLIYSYTTYSTTFSDLNITDIISVEGYAYDNQYDCTDTVYVQNFRLMYDYVTTNTTIMKPSNNLQYDNTTLSNVIEGGSTYGKLQTIGYGTSQPLVDNLTGTARFSWSYRKSSTSSHSFYFQIRRNGTVVYQAPTHTYTGTTNAVQSRTADITFNMSKDYPNEVWELWGYASSTSGTHEATDFKISFDGAPPAYTNIYNVDSFDNNSLSGFNLSSGSVNIVNKQVVSTGTAVVLSNSTVTTNEFIWDINFINSSGNTLGFVFLGKNSSSFYTVRPYTTGGFPVTFQIYRFGGTLLKNSYSFTPTVGVPYRGRVILYTYKNSTFDLLYPNGTSAFQIGFNTTEDWGANRTQFYGWRENGGTAGSQTIDNFAYPSTSSSFYDDAETATIQWTDLKTGSGVLNRTQESSGNWVYQSNKTSSSQVTYLNTRYISDAIISMELNYTDYDPVTSKYEIRIRGLENSINNQSNYKQFRYNIVSGNYALDTVNNGTLTNDGYVYSPVSSNVTNMLKIKLLGSDMWAKQWQKGTNEPGWTLTATNTTFKVGFLELATLNASVKFDNISITTDFTEPDITTPTIDDYWSSVHGENNSAVVDTIATNSITFQLNLSGFYDNVKFWRDGNLLYSGASPSYVYSNAFAPLNNSNITARACYYAECTQNVSWLINTSELPYTGSNPNSLANLQTPTTTQVQYIYGNQKYFFKATYGGSGWILNNTTKTSECTGACTGISTYPLEFWLKPVDGSININTKRTATMSNALTIYVNDSLYGTYDLNNVADDYTIVLTGLNPANISDVKITSATDDDFFLYSINYNRTYPALYDGTNYFQMKKTAISRYNYYKYNNSNFETDLDQIKAHNFNMISVPLMWGDLVDDVRPYPNGTSYNLYNQSSLKTLDYIIDEADAKGLYVSFWWNQFYIAGIKNVSSLTIGYPCTHCLINSTERDSIKQLLFLISDRYKLHTNVMLDIPFETFDGLNTDSKYYADAENVASWQAYSGYSDSTLPHDGTASDVKWFSMWKWQYENFYSLSNQIIPYLNANGQLVSMNNYPRRLGNGAYTEYSVRINRNVSNYNFIGNPLYPDNTTSNMSNISTIISYGAYSDEIATNMKSYGYVPYWSEFGFQNRVSYVSNKDTMLTAVISNTIISVQNTDYNTNLGLGGYSLWSWKEADDCANGVVLAYCYGIEYMNDTYALNDTLITSLNQAFGISSSSPSSPHSSETTGSHKFEVNLTKIANTITWYINGTQVQQNTSVITANYTNSSAVIGNWEIIASATDGVTTVNQTWIWTVGSFPPASITNPQTATGNFYINNTWVNPVDSDFDHVTFKYANGTLLQNVSTPTSYLNLTYSSHYQQNISAQTVDISGNINSTLVWFNATILYQSIQVFNSGWQPVMINDTMTTSQFNSLYGVTWLSYWNSTSQKFETYKAGWPYRNSLSMVKGAGVMARFSTNKTITMLMNASYNWTISNPGWTMQGLDETKNLSQINASVNTACAVDKIAYLNLSTQIESVFTCGQAGNGSIQVLAGNAVFMNATQVVDKERVWLE